MQTIEEQTNSHLAKQLDEWRAVIKANLRGVEDRTDKGQIPLGCFPLVQAAIDVAAFASAFVEDEETGPVPNICEGARVEMDRRVRWLSYCAAQLCANAWPEHGLEPPND